MNTKALIVPASRAEAVRVEYINAGLHTLQQLVAGNIEAATSGPWHAYLNEEGRILGLAPNVRATHLMIEAGVPFHDLIAGIAVFLGHDEMGEEADVPELLVRIAEDLFEVPLNA